MAKKSVGIVDSLKHRAAALPLKNATWFDRLDDAAKAELQEAKAAYLRGEIRAGRGAMSLSRFASLLSAELAERKIATVGRQGVETWLKRN